LLPTLHDAVEYSGIKSGPSVFTTWDIPLISNGAKPDPNYNYRKETKKKFPIPISNLKPEVMATADEEEGEVVMVRMGSYGGKARVLLVGEESAAEETMLLWGIQQPTLSKPNAFVSQSSLQLRLDACGHSLSILQSPSSLVSHPSFFFLFSYRYHLGHCSWLFGLFNCRARLEWLDQWCGTVVLCWQSF